MELFEQWGSPERTPDAVRELLERKAKLFGFGHPLYRAYDPRAVILKRLSEELSHDAGEPNWFAITDAAERTVFEEKRLYPNVDLYSASVYRYLGIPTDLFTPVFAASRTAGQAAHVLEQHARQQDHPALGDLRRRAAPPVSAALMTLADAAAEADALAEEGNERELSQLRAQWDEELESAARASDFRERAVAYRAIGQFRFRTKIELLRRGLEDDSPAVRGSALLALEQLSRDHPGRRQRRAPAVARAAHARRQRGGAPPRGRLAEERLAAARHDPDARVASATTTSSRASCAKRPRRSRSFFGARAK